jgi:hypothetical protein
MPRYSNGLRCCAVLFILLFALGCGNNADIYPVHGTVVFSDGSPATELAGGLIVFKSLAGKPGNANGSIQGDATFRMSTKGGHDGAYLGKHQAIVTPPRGDRDNARPNIIHRRHMDFETSGIEIEVQPKTNDITITVDRFKS